MLLEEKEEEKSVANYTGKRRDAAATRDGGIRIKRNALFTFVARYGIPNSDNFLCPTFPFFPGNAENKM